jgi:hypothetical protein
VQFLEFAFRSFWNFVGVLVLISLIGSFLCGIVCSMPRKKVVYTCHCQNCTKDANVSKLNTKEG